MEIIIESAIEVFAKQFPLRGITDEDGIRFTVRAHRAAFYEKKASRIILSNKLPLEVNKLEWSNLRRGVFETVIEVRYVPSMEDCPCY